MASRDCHWLTLLCGLLLAALPLSAAAGPLPAHVAQAIVSPPIQPPPSATLYFVHLTIKRVLSQSTLTAILQDATPPFWESWLFRGLLLLVLAGIILGAYRWRIASIESRNRQLAVEVAERTLTIAGQTADLEALYQADEELERHVQLDQVLQALVNIAVDLLDADKSAVVAWDDRRERLVIRVARNFSAGAISQLTFAPGEGYVGQVMAAGGPVMVEDAESDLLRVLERPEVITAILGEGIRSFMHIPIRPAAGGGTQPNEGSPQPGEVFGVFTVCYAEPRAFDEREPRLFTALAQRGGAGCPKCPALRRGAAPGGTVSRPR